MLTSIVHKGYPWPTGTCGLVGVSSLLLLLSEAKTSKMAFVSPVQCPKARKGGFPVIRAFGSSVLSSEGTNSQDVPPSPLKVHSQ